MSSICEGVRCKRATAPDTPSTSNKAVISAIVANVAVTTVKFIAAILSGSSAMLSEGVHSLVDTTDSVLLYVGLRLSRRPPDRSHPLGHGREVYFWSMVVSMLIFGAGCCVNIFEGVRRILYPTPADHLGWNYAVLGVSAAFDLTSLCISVRQFRKEHRGRPFFQSFIRTKDPSTFAVIFEDSADLLGVIAAGLGIWASAQFDMPVFDGVASIVIGAILAVTAFLLGRECHGLLIGESANQELVDQIVQSARINDNIVAIGDPLTMYFGPHDVMVAVSVRFRDDLDARSLSDTIDEMQCAIRQAAPDVKRIFIEAEALLGLPRQPQGVGD